MNTYYTPSANPTPGAPGSSSTIRNEFNLIATAFDNLSAATEGTSTTSLTIGTGTKVFATTKQFVAGQFFSATSAANSANYMHGVVVSYVNPTLTTTVTDISGTGTFADWNLSISGSQGLPGPSGGLGPADVKTAAFNAVVSNRYICDTVTTAAFTATLPAAPSAGDYIIFYPGSAWTSNNLTVARNGLNINGVAQDLVCDVTHEFELTYISAAEGWLVAPR